MMQKGVLSIIISGVLVISLVLWYSVSQYALDLPEIFIGISILLFAIFFTINGVKWIRQSRQGLPVEDELSRKVNLNAGYYSYLISVYWWVALYFLQDKFEATGTLLATGIIGMAAFFIIALAYFGRKTNL